MNEKKYGGYLNAVLLIHRCYVSKILQLLFLSYNHTKVFPFLTNFWKLDFLKR